MYLSIAIAALLTTALLAPILIAVFAQSVAESVNRKYGKGE